MYNETRALEVAFTSLKLKVAELAHNQVALLEANPVEVQKDSQLKDEPYYSTQLLI